MKKIAFLAVLSIAFLTSKAQVYTDSTIDMSAKRVQWAGIQQFAIGSYGEAHYNQVIDGSTRNNGTIDLHRVITYLGYRFNENLQFFSEIEYEHTDEIYLEQAFINYHFNDKFNFKAGQLLMPMGYVNEFHEPTLFNGVERPNVDKYVIPSTWKEMGFGFHGLMKKASIKYQLYAVNGFLGYDNGATISGSSGLRGARQGGDKSLLRTPSFIGKFSYYGINGLLIEGSYYTGKTESVLNNGLDLTESAAVKVADSSIMGLSMAGLNFTYNLKALQLRGVAIYTTLSNTKQYNGFTGAEVGNSILGYYGEIAYELDLKPKGYLKLIPFIRYENYNTHNSVNKDISKNEAYNRTEIVTGAGLKLAPGAIFKADLQMVSDASRSDFTNILNIGFGYWF